MDSFETFDSVFEQNDDDMVDNMDFSHFSDEEEVSRAQQGDVSQYEGQNESYEQNTSDPAHLDQMYQDSQYVDQSTAGGEYDDEICEEEDENNDVVEESILDVSDSDPPTKTAQDYLSDAVDDMMIGIMTVCDDSISHDMTSDVLTNETRFVDAELVNTTLALEVKSAALADIETEATVAAIEELVFKMAMQEKDDTDQSSTTYTDETIDETNNEAVDETIDETRDETRNETLGEMGHEFTEQSTYYGNETLNEANDDNENIDEDEEVVEESMTNESEFDQNINESETLEEQTHDEYFVEKETEGGDHDGSADITASEFFGYPGAVMMSQPGLEQIDESISEQVNDSTMEQENEKIVSTEETREFHEDSVLIEEEMKETDIAVAEDVIYPTDENVVLDEGLMMDETTNETLDITSVEIGMETVSDIAPETEDNIAAEMIIQVQPISEEMRDQMVEADIEAQIALTAANMADISMDQSMCTNKTVFVEATMADESTVENSIKTSTVASNSTVARKPRTKVLASGPHTTVITGAKPAVSSTAKTNMASKPTTGIKPAPISTIAKMNTSVVKPSAVTRPSMSTASSASAAIPGSRLNSSSNVSKMSVRTGASTSTTTSTATASRPAPSSANSNTSVSTVRRSTQLPSSVTNNTSKPSIGASSSRTTTAPLPRASLGGNSTAAPRPSMGGISSATRAPRASMSASATSTTSGTSAASSSPSASAISRPSLGARGGRPSMTSSTASTSTTTGTAVSSRPSMSSRMSVGSSSSSRVTNASSSSTSVTPLPRASLSGRPSATSSTPTPLPRASLSGRPSMGSSASTSTSRLMRPTAASTARRSLKSDSADDSTTTSSLRPPRRSLAPSTSMEPRQSRMSMGAGINSSRVGPLGSSTPGTRGASSSVAIAVEAPSCPPVFRDNELMAIRSIRLPSRDEKMVATILVALISAATKVNAGKKELWTFYLSLAISGAVFNPKLVLVDELLTAEPLIALPETIQVLPTISGAAKRSLDIHFKKIYSWLEVRYEERLVKTQQAETLHSDIEAQANAEAREKVEIGQTIELDME